MGGAERVLQTLCTQLPRLGFETGLSTLRDLGPVGQAIAQSGVPAEERVTAWPSSLAALPGLVAHLRRVDPDLLYVLDHSNALFLGRLAARLAGIPNQVCAIHRTRRADGSPSLGWSDRLLMPLSDAVIAVSQGQADYLHRHAGLDSARIRVIYNGVTVEDHPMRPTDVERLALRQELEIPADATVLAIVAALRPEKNHELLFEALSGLDGVGDPHLLILGGGVREQDLRARAESLGISPQLHWLGIREDVPRILGAVDLLVLSSHPVVETFPLCVLEGMSAGLPVVSTRVGSLAEMVEDGETGLLVTPGDADEFARALASLIENPPRAQAMGQAGRLRALRNFDRHFMVEGSARLLRSLVER